MNRQNCKILKKGQRVNTLGHRWVEPRKGITQKGGSNQQKTFNTPAATLSSYQKLMSSWMRAAINNPIQRIRSNATWTPGRNPFERINRETRSAMFQQREAPNCDET